MQNSSTCKAINIIYLKPSPMDAMYCSTSGISVVALADSQSLSCWRSMTG